MLKMTNGNSEPFQGCLHRPISLRDLACPAEVGMLSTLLLPGAGRGSCPCTMGPWLQAARGRLSWGAALPRQAFPGTFGFEHFQDVFVFFS